VIEVARWRGFKDLMSDVVVNGAARIERVHLDTAHRPFVMLEHVPGIGRPVAGIHEFHDAIVSVGYAAVRVVARVIDVAADLALDQMEPDGPTE
jgi:hypothetical protein